MKPAPLQVHQTGWRRSGPSSPVTPPTPSRPSFPSQGRPAPSSLPAPACSDKNCSLALEGLVDRDLQLTVDTAQAQQIIATYGNDVTIATISELITQEKIAFP
jgi:hypothetical protein